MGPLALPPGLVRELFWGLLHNKFVMQCLFQVCQLIMGNWEYDGDERHLHLGSNGVTADMAFTENGEWRLANSSGCAFVIQGPEPLPHLKVTLTVM